MADKIDSRLIPELNLITLGHVDHGKTTLTQALSGKWTDVHSEERKRGITLRLGYADVTIYKCKKCGALGTSAKCAKCFEEAEPQRTFSIIDAPGHETLMATVLAGSALADGVLFVIAANEECPQPQTKEHLMVLDIAGIKNVIIVQSKIDLVSEEQALKNYKQIKNLVKGTVAENAPIIPISAQQKINTDILLQAIQEKIFTPKRKENESRMLVARSFDINKPGSAPQELKGGVLGGSIVQGKFKIGEEIEIAPGIKKGNKWEPLRTKIIGLQKAGKNLEEAGAGGLLGIMTQLDPSLTKSDSLAGSVIGLPAKLPAVRNELNLKVNLLERIVGFEEKVKPLAVNEPLMIIVGVSRTVGTMASLGKVVNIKLKMPVCCDAGEKVALSRRIADRWRLIGWGTVV